MDRLWAPWRLKYVSKKVKTKGCVFCESLRNPHKNFVVFKQTHVFCLLNIYPYTNGHSMIVSNRHGVQLDDLSCDESTDLMNGIKHAMQLLRIVLNPDGYNCGINIGEVAGAGITDHLHVHIVPRWKGDTNFMPVTGNAKVICQSLHDLHKKLLKEQNGDTYRGKYKEI